MLEKIKLSFEDSAVKERLTLLSEVLCEDYDLNPKSGEILTNLIEYKKEIMKNERFIFIIENIDTTLNVSIKKQYTIKFEESSDVFLKIEKHSTMENIKTKYKYSDSDYVGTDYFIKQEGFIYQFSLDKDLVTGYVKDENLAQPRYIEVEIKKLAMKYHGLKILSENKYSLERKYTKHHEKYNKFLNYFLEDNNLKIFNLLNKKIAL